MPVELNCCIKHTVKFLQFVVYDLLGKVEFGAQVVLDIEF